MVIKKKIAFALIAVGSIGFMVGVFYPYHPSASLAPAAAPQGLESSLSSAANSLMQVPSDNLLQAGLLILSIVLIATGSYLAGYLKATTFTSRVTLDFTKKIDSIHPNIK